MNFLAVADQCLSGETCCCRSNRDEGNKGELGETVTKGRKELQLVLQGGEGRIHGLVVIKERRQVSPSRAVG